MRTSGCFPGRVQVASASPTNFIPDFPEKKVHGLINEVRQLGQVQYLIAPNTIHHLFMVDWMTLFPEARTYSAPGLKEKRKDIRFTKELKDLPENEWVEEINQLIFYGSTVMDEVVFFHKNSKTLILTDLIENVHSDFIWVYEESNR